MKHLKKIIIILLIGISMSKAKPPVPFEIQEKKVSFLINSLKSNELNIRLQSAEQLGYYSNITPEKIIKALSEIVKTDSNYHVRFYAVLSLKNIQQYKKYSISLDTSIQSILKYASNDISSDVRFQSSVNMSLFNSVPFVNKSIQAAGFDNSDIFYSLEDPAKGRPRRNHYLDPKKLLQEKSKLLPKLLIQLKGNDIELCLGAIKIFNTMKYWPPQVMDEYTNLISNPHPHIRLNVLSAPLPIDSYLKCLQDEYWLIRKMSARFLGEREITSQIAKALVNTFNDSIADVAIFCVDALYNIKPENNKIISIVLPGLIKAMESDYWELQYNTAHIIGKFEQNSKPALQTLIKILRSAKIKDSDLPNPNYGNLKTQEEIQIKVLNTIEKMGPIAKEAIPHLKWAVKQKHLRDEAVNALKAVNISN